ncbi:MAG: hypothetical protein WA261_20125 [Candidatus Sulfotelmatobacter sp.]
MKIKTVRNVGIVLAGAILTSSALFLLGVVTSLAGNKGWVHLGEYQPWLPLVGLEYGVPLGIIIGVIVAIRKSSKPKAD